MWTPNEPKIKSIQKWLSTTAHSNHLANPIENNRHTTHQFGIRGPPRCNRSQCITRWWLVGRHPCYLLYQASCNPFSRRKRSHLLNCAIRWTNARSINHLQPYSRKNSLSSTKAPRIWHANKLISNGKTPQILYVNLTSHPKSATSLRHYASKLLQKTWNPWWNSTSLNKINEK